jgi:hypothetical protein
MDEAESRAGILVWLSSWAATSLLGVASFYIFLSILERYASTLQVMLIRHIACHSNNIISATIFAILPRSMLTTAWQ